MSDLQKQFPIAQVSNDRLSAIAARARASAKTALPQRRHRPRLLEVAAILLMMLLGYLTWENYASPAAPQASIPIDAPNKLNQRIPVKDDPPLPPAVAPAPTPPAPPPDERFDKRRNAIGLALAWLAAQQDPDGRFDSRRFKAEAHSTATTGLALLAFISAGHTEQHGSYQKTVKRGLQWLMAQQKPNGKILFADDNDNGYPTAIASLAMVLGMAPDAEGQTPATRLAAQRAVDYCANIHQAENGGFGYVAGKSGHSSPTGWFGQVLLQAQASGLNVNPKSLKNLSAYLDLARSKGSNGYAYSPGGVMSLNCSAIGFLLRGMAGATPEDLKPGIDEMLAKSGYPVWQDKWALYSWYFAGPSVLAQKEKVAQKWSAQLDIALLPTQLMEGDLRGSWPGPGDYIFALGTLGQTAMGALCLTQTYRHDTGEKGTIEPIPDSVKPINPAPLPSSAAPPPPASPPVDDKPDDKF